MSTDGTHADLPKEDLELPREELKRIAHEVAFCCLLTGNDLTGRLSLSLAEIIGLLNMAARAVSVETIRSLFGAALRQGYPCVVGNMSMSDEAARLLARDLGPFAQALQSVEPKS